MPLWYRQIPVEVDEFRRCDRVLPGKTGRNPAFAPQAGENARIMGPKTEKAESCFQDSAFCTSPHCAVDWAKN